MNHTKHSLTLVGFFITLLGALFFSTKAIIVKSAFRDIKTDALTLLTLRMFFSLPFYLIAAYFISRKKDNNPMTMKQWFGVSIVGLTGYYISSLFDFIGLQYITAGLERLILFLYPALVLLINAYFFGQKVNVLQKIALLLTYSGIGLAFFGELNLDAHNADFYYGSFMVFLCAVTYSIYITFSGRMVPLIGAGKFTTYAMLAATTGIFLHFSFAGDSNTLNTGKGLWWYGLLLALFATVIPSFMLSFGIKKIGANNVAIVSTVGPVSTILQGHYFLGEPLFAEQIAGTLLVIAGVLLIGWKRKNAI